MSHILTTPSAQGHLIGPRDANSQPIPITLDEQAARLKQTLLKDIRRSAYVYRVDCGGCNGCEIEIFAAISPLFDAERFGIKVVASPRHATPTSCCLPVPSPVRCASRRYAPTNRPPIPRS